jgi:glycosyltransferase involved in cell wall biosynthesis
VLFKIFFDSVLVYDTHEIETECIGTAGFRKKIFKLIEKVLIRFVDAVITVNDSIRDWYKKEYKISNIVAVRNIPLKMHKTQIYKNNILKSNFGIRHDEILFLYLGILDQGRGIDIVLNVFSKINDNKHVLFIGFGELEAFIKKYQKAFSNIHFLDAVKPSEVSRYTCGADVGLCLIENTCLSYYLSLPNKLYEYIINDVPVIVSDFPVMGRVIDEYGCGWKVAVDQNDLYSLIKSISKCEIDAKRERAKKYRKKIGWEHEEKVLINFYRNMLACTISDKRNENP